MNGMRLSHGEALVWDIRVVAKPERKLKTTPKKIPILYIDNDRAYLIQVLDNKLGNRFWNGVAK